MDGCLMRYSEAFKLRVVEALESGEVASIQEARLKFGVGGCATVQNWLRKYGRNHLVPKVVRVETPGEVDRLRELKKENARLKTALADEHMEGALYRSWFEVACKEFGVKDAEAYKKKVAARLSK